MLKIQILQLTAQTLNSISDGEGNILICKMGTNCMESYGEQLS